jgi:deoxyribose-phosphate aldolase
MTKTKQKLYSHIDLTLLKATASWRDIEALCEDAIRYRTAAACIPPCYVRRVYEQYGGLGLNICTVVGFPLGYSAPTVKMVEARQALADGAREIDMVINIADAKDGRYGGIFNEIALVREAVGDAVLKVIIETCFLSDEEKARLCGVVSRVGADYIKTSTGFGEAGAGLHDIKLFKKYLAPSVKIKAAGGIKTRKDIERFIAAGCDRIGSSSAVAALEGQDDGA